MQRGAAIDAHGLRSLQEPLLTRLVILVVVIVFLFLVTALGGSLLLVVLAAAASLDTTLLAGSLGTILALLFVPPLILSFLLLSKQLDLSAILEVVVVGVLGTGVPRLACLRPMAWLSQQALRPIFINKASKILARVQASRSG